MEEILSLELLGPPRAARGGMDVQVDTRKAVALLAYLAETRVSQSRAALANLLWSEYDDDRARAALRRTLSNLKSALGDRWLSIDRAAVG
nr:SARP family transcriptional regulator [Actinomycetota bacterium]